MMKAKQILVMILILAAGFAAGVWIAGGGEEAQGSAEAEATRGEGGHDHGGKDASKERKILYWRAPMNPNYISDKPGKSPMGMDLVPVYEDEVMGAGGGVKIDPTTVQNIGVKTAAVKRQPLRRTVRTVGRVDYDETLVTDVNTKIAGWVEKLFVDYTGQEVKKGQPLLEIYSPELVAAQEEYLTALDYVRRMGKSAPEVAEGARDLLNSARQRLLYWDITEAQIAGLERTRQVKRAMTIYSPQRGIVVHKAVLEGAHIRAGERLYRIADLSRVWVYADIYEYEIPWIREGQAAEVELTYDPGRTLRGKVTYIYPFLESKTRTAKVRMVFPNPDLTLKPEMYATVKIQPVVSRDAVVVPTQAVIHSGERNVIILSLGEGRFLPREVVLGVETDEGYEVVEGLKAGERIVTSSQFLIDSESNLKAALAGMAQKPSGKMEMPEAPRPSEMQKEGAAHTGRQH